MTVATTDGDTTWAFRYSSEGKSCSLFRSTDVSALRALHPTNELVAELTDEATNQVRPGDHDRVTDRMNAGRQGTPDARP